MLTERSREIPWLLDRAAGARDLLDIGAAGSKYLPALSQVAHQVTAIDTRPFIVPYGVTGIVADAVDLPGDWTGRFDTVACISVLDHVGLDAYGNMADSEALERVAAEMARVTRRGGRLLVTVPVGRPQVTTHPNGGQRVFSPVEIVELFSGNWRQAGACYWQLIGDEYHLTSANGAAGAEYLELRAGAVGAWEFVRL